MIRHKAIRHKAIIFGMFFCVGLSSTASAITTSMADGVLTFTVTAGTCPGPNLTYTPSPSTLMSSTSIATAYTITAASSKTDTDNGMEYGILSTSEGYFQRKQATDNDVTPTDDATALPTGGDPWLDKNGVTPAP